MTLFSETQKGDQFVGFAACTKVRVDEAKNKKAYCDLTLFDGKTEVMGKIWDFEGPQPLEDTILKIAGPMDEYRGNKQIKITQWRQTKPEDEIDPANFMPVTPLDREWMQHELFDIIQQITDEDYKNIVTSFFQVYGEEIYNCPAAISHHHAYLGGWMEHTLSVAGYAMSGRRDYANYDLLLAGALLHDLGKLFSYSWDGCSIKMTRKGRLLDHIVIGLQMLEIYKENVGMDDLKYELLCHLIASHHGKLEWGSPVEPACKEAFILHSADLADATMWKIDNALENAAEDTEWATKPKGMKYDLFANTGY